MIKLLAWLYSKKILKKLSLKHKIKILLSSDIDVYYELGSIRVVSRDIGTAIETMKYVLSVDYSTEYAVSIHNKITPYRIVFGMDWLNINNMLVSNEIFKEWLEHSLIVNDLYLEGTSVSVNSRAYLNSTKLAPVIGEITSICDAMLK